MTYVMRFDNRLGDKVSYCRRGLVGYDMMRMSKKKVYGNTMEKYTNTGFRTYKFESDDLFCFSVSSLVASLIGIDYSSRKSSKYESAHED